MTFLSTPSVRRATRSAHASPTPCRHFYPRPPRGGRPVQVDSLRHPGAISIHALREEGDLGVALGVDGGAVISIHALREEGDSKPRSHAGATFDFYPRPPRGGRPILSLTKWRYFCISIHALREEGDAAPPHLPGPAGIFLSTPSARRANARWNPAVLIPVFLSTPSARRATSYTTQRDRANCISIHALREEGDGLYDIASP